MVLEILYHRVGLVVDASGEYPVTISYQVRTHKNGYEVFNTRTNRGVSTHADIWKAIQAARACNNFASTGKTSTLEAL